MRIGLLVCDHVDEAQRSIAGDYPDMFDRLLQDAWTATEAAPELEIVLYDAVAGELPDDPAECDAWLCSGSRQSVYDDDGWIASLEGFVRQVHDGGVPFAGICFGHQLLAQALGGRVERAPNGWGAGARTVEVVEREPWMDPPLDDATLLFMHQDQVLDPPPGAVLLARTDHCAVAAFRVDRMVGVQAHPEFVPAYVAALLDARVARIGEDATAAARASLAHPTDEATVARWLVRFLAAPR